MILIVIPTLDHARGESVGKAALVGAGCEARVFVSHDSKREGFTKTANAGMRQIRPGEDICLLNDDVSNFPLGWLRILHRGLYSQPRIGIVGPSGASGTAPLRGGKPGMTGIQIVKQVPFWCALFKSEMIDAIGLLDEAFIHYASDNWYCRGTMRRAGWKCAWCKDVFLVHRKHGSGRHNAWRKHDHALFHKRMGRK